MYYILLFALGGLFLIGICVYKSVFNPVSVFNAVWFIVCFLYGFRLSPNIQPPLLNRTCDLLILGNVVFTIACILTSKLAFRFATNFKKNEKDEVTFKNIQRHFWIWFILEIFETVYSKGMPLIWTLQNNGKTYVDYGVPSLHGLANAYGLAIVTILFYQAFDKKYKDVLKKIIFYIVIIIFMYLLMLTRQVLISAAIQFFVVYCFRKKRIPVMKLVIGVLSLIMLFGILGNIRTGYTEFLAVAQINTKINPLFIGFYWVYIYLTMTIANLNKLFNLVFMPVGINYFLSIFVPTVLVDSLFKNNIMNVPNFLVVSNFNVSGYNAEIYVSFGIIGIIIMALIYGILGGIVYKKISRKENMKNILYYAVYYQIIILSFFYNQLFYLPSGFQFIIIYLLFKNVRFKR